jgi:Protein of unknown function (DUF4019)
MKRISVFLIFTLLAYPTLAQNYPKSVNKAHPSDKVVKGFLTLVDAGEYEATYAYAPTFVKRSMSEKNFAAGLRVTCTMYGTLTSRKLKSKVARKDLPVGSKGDYYIVDYSAKVGKNSLIERLILFDEKGRWKVFSYYRMPPSAAAQMFKE